MRVTIPTDFSHIPLRMWVDFKGAKDDIERVIAVTGMGRKQAMGLKPETIGHILDLFDTALLTEKPNHRQRIKIDGTEYGFIPDLTKMSYAEHVDLSTLASAVWGKEPYQFHHLPRLMAILYRPINPTERVGKFYRLNDYDSDLVDTYIEDIGKLPMDAVSAALLFFSTTSKELVTASRLSLDRMMMKTLSELMEEVKNLDRKQDHPEGSRKDGSGSTFSKFFRSVTSRVTRPFSKNKHTKSLYT
jgi:hypothetical protein